MTMLEKAAKAAAAEMQKVEMIDAAPSVIAALQARRVVRAVLMAVRWPDMDAVNAGIKAGHAASGLPDILHVPSAFTAMIDAILNEKTEGLSDD